MRKVLEWVAWCSLALQAASVALAAEASNDYVQLVLGDHPAAFWTFEQLARDNEPVFTDSVQGCAAKVQGGVGVVPAGHTGRAALFSGKTSYLELAPGELSLESGSLEFWFSSTQKWDRVQWPGSASLISKALPGPASGDWTINGGSLEPGLNEGRVFISCGARDNDGDLVLNSGCGLNDGTWHHVVWTRSSAGANRLYIDAELVAEGEDGGGCITNARPIQVGGDPHENGHFLVGAIDDLAFYTNIISAERVRTHCIAGGVTPAAHPAVNSLPQPQERLRLENDHGLVWEFGHETNGWALGRLALHGQSIEAPARRGLLSLRNRQSGATRWLAAEKVEKKGTGSATFSGRAVVEGATLEYKLKVELLPFGAGVALEPSWEVDRSLSGWDLCLAYHDSFTRDWRVQSYPFAGNSTRADLAPMRYCGVPGALIYRPDLSLVLLYAIDSRFDYLNPTSWTGHTGFHFENRRTAPQFRIGPGSFQPGTRYRHPLQLFLTDAGEFAPAITSLVKTWMRATSYNVELLPLKRSPEEALAVYMEGRRKSRLWVDGIGYEHNVSPAGQGCGFVHLCNVSYSAYLEYLLYESTREPLWRERALTQVNTLLRAQQTNAAMPDFGAIHDNYQLRPDRGHAPGTFHSQDWAQDGYKVDVMAHIVRYLLLITEAVQRNEGVDHPEWRLAAQRCADWILKQQNSDGGLPQHVEVTTGKRSNSVVSHRALAAFPYIAQATGDARYNRLASDLEGFLRRQVEGRFWFTGSHPDLPPNDFEQDSVWGAVEYWLNKHDHTGDREALERALADVYFVLLFWCPRQLSWVKNPTQCAHSEQQHFNQYSVYCFQNRKVECLDRLWKKTGDGLFARLRDRVISLNIYTQVAEPGPWQGGFTEAIADPWLERRAGFEWVGVTYTSELCTDFFLQLVEMGLANPVKK